MRSTMIFALLATGSVMVLAQAPPIKMGLWEKKMVTSDGKGAPTTMTAKSCINPEEWQEMVANASKQREGCTMSNVKNAHGYSFNGSCTLPHGGTMVMSGSLVIQDYEHIVAESHSTMTTNGQKRQIDSNSKSSFLSTNCGAVKPGEPEIEP